MKLPTIEHVMLFSKPDLDPKVRDGVKTLLEREGVIVSLWNPGLDSVRNLPDLLICLGGDGTILHASPWAASRGVPVLGVNHGHLGYLTAFGGAEFEESVGVILKGGLPVQRRCRLAVHVYRLVAEGSTTVQRCTHSGEALNELAILYRPDRRAIDLLVKVNGDEMATYKGDGLLVSTATGSTAHNLAAGGPILYPTASSCVITPLSPHGLTRTPMVVDPDSEIEIVFQGSRTQEPWVNLDGKSECTMFPGDRILVAPAEKPLYLCPSRRGVFRTMQDKLGWNGTPRA